LKICTKCKENKELSEFNKNKRKPDGLMYSCKACRVLYRTTVQKHIKEKNAQYYIENAEKIKKQARDWHSANREYNNTRRRLWNKENPSKRKEQQLTYRTMKYNAAQAETLLERQMIAGLYLISNILTKSCGEAFHVDHIHPLSKGGSHTFDNLQILSAEENLAKGAKT